ncbi:MAG: hypothetical protein N2689_13880, partial [Verrucomicrobiae bacterium]|nr:hypothetical protein [Verrucomicrobiae bacterium]
YVLVSVGTWLCFEGKRAGSRLSFSEGAAKATKKKQAKIRKQKAQTISWSVCAAVLIGSGMLCQAGAQTTSS